ncbi:hypothetical protein CCYA_CCYA09G2585 [Cyanidiococcus yangmingshanensis]|nr:hypothetical protein CCYA_CCYA09G2585 [Cyanidiococcus yangmingshanensis]
MATKKDSSTLIELQNLVLWALEALTRALVPIGGVLCCLDPDDLDLFGAFENNSSSPLGLLRQFRSDLSGPGRMQLFTGKECLDHVAEGAVDGCVTFCALDSAFENATCCEALLRRVAGRLRPGCRFFGICVDSASAWTSIQKEFEARQIGRSISEKWLETSLRAGGLLRLSIDETTNSYARAAYGHEFCLGRSDDIENNLRRGYLVNFAELVRIAPQYGLVFREALNLRDLWDEFHRPLQYCEEMRSFYQRFPGQQFRPSPAVLDSAIYFSTFVIEAVADPGQR